MFFQLHHFLTSVCSNFCFILCCSVVVWILYTIIYKLTCLKGHVDYLFLPLSLSWCEIKRIEKEIDLTLRKKMVNSQSIIPLNTHTHTHTSSAIWRRAIFSKVHKIYIHTLTPHIRTAVIPIWAISAECVCVRACVWEGAFKGFDCDL